MFFDKKFEYCRFKILDKARKTKKSRKVNLYFFKNNQDKYIILIFKIAFSKHLLLSRILRELKKYGKIKHPKRSISYAKTIHKLCKNDP